MIETTRSRVSLFMNKFRRLGLISYNENIEVHNSLLNAVLHDEPEIERIIQPTKTRRSQKEPSDEQGNCARHRVVRLIDLSGSSLQRSLVASLLVFQSVFRHADQRSLQQR